MGGAGELEFELKVVGLFCCLACSCWRMRERGWGRGGGFLEVTLRLGKPIERLFLVFGDEISIWIEPEPERQTSTLR